MSESDQELRIVPTEYFDISANHPELKGNLVGEILNSPEGPSVHISKKEGKRLSQQGNGDIVIMEISQQGWDRIVKIFDGLSNPTMDDVRRALTEQEFITWHKPGTGH